MTLADWNNSGLLEHLTKAGFSMTTEAITSYSNLKKNNNWKCVESCVILSSVITSFLRFHRKADVVSHGISSFEVTGKIIIKLAKQIVID